MPINSIPQEIKTELPPNAGFGFPEFLRRKGKDMVRAALIPGILIFASITPATAEEAFPGESLLPDGYVVGESKKTRGVAVGTAITRDGSTGNPVAATHSLYKYKKHGKRVGHKVDGLSKKLFVGGGVYGWLKHEYGQRYTTRWSGPFIYNGPSMVGLMGMSRVKGAGFLRVKGTDILFIGKPRGNDGSPVGRFILPDGTHVLGSSHDSFDYDGTIKTVVMKNGETISFGAPGDIKYRGFSGFRAVGYDEPGFKGWGVHSPGNPIAGGAAIIAFKDGRRYQGGFFEGQLQGNGHMQYPDGAEEWGYWDMGVGNRELIYKNPDGAVFFGRREYGKRVGQFFQMSERGVLEVSLSIDEQKLAQLDEQFAMADEVFASFAKLAQTSTKAAMKFARKPGRNFTKMKLEGNTNDVIDIAVNTPDAENVVRQIKSHMVSATYNFGADQLDQLDQYLQTSNAWPAPDFDIVNRKILKIAEYSNGKLVRTFDQNVESCGMALVKVGYCAKRNVVSVLPFEINLSDRSISRLVVTARIERLRNEGVVSETDKLKSAKSFILSSYDPSNYVASGFYRENTKLYGYGQQGDALGSFSKGIKDGLVWRNGIERCHYKNGVREADCFEQAIISYSDTYRHPSLFVNIPFIEMTMIGRYVGGLRHGPFSYINKNFGITGTISYDMDVETSRFVIKDRNGQVIEDTQMRVGLREGSGKCSYAGVLEDCNFSNGLRMDAAHIARVEGILATEKAEKLKQERLAALAAEEERKRIGKEASKARMEASFARNKAIRDASKREDKRRSQAYWNKVFDATARRYSGGSNSGEGTSGGSTSSGSTDTWREPSPGGATSYETEVACDLPVFLGFDIGQGNGKHGVAIPIIGPTGDNPCRPTSNENNEPSRTGAQ